MHPIGDDACGVDESVDFGGQVGRDNASAWVKQKDALVNRNVPHMPCVRPVQPGPVEQLEVLDVMGKQHVIVGCSE